MPGLKHPFGSEIADVDYKTDLGLPNSESWPGVPREASCMGGCAVLKGDSSVMSAGGGSSMDARLDSVVTSWKTCRYVTSPMTARPAQETCN